MVILASEVYRYKTLLNKNSAKDYVLCQSDHQVTALGVADVSHAMKSCQQKTNYPYSMPREDPGGWRAVATGLCTVLPNDTHLTARGQGDQGCQRERVQKARSSSCHPTLGQRNRLGWHINWLLCHSNNRLKRSLKL